MNPCNDEIYAVENILRRMYRIIGLKIYAHVQALYFDRVRAC